MNILQTKLDIPACQMCGKLSRHTLHSHHVIPRYMECSDDDDIIQLCRGCHKRADERFDTLILDPFKRGRGIRWEDKKKKRQYDRDYMKKYGPEWRKRQPEYQKQYYLKNKDKVKAKVKEYSEKNKLRLKEQRRNRILKQKVGRIIHE